ncbi:hypothetical protein OEZ86_003755 [Tetradesmus obliquus]|nr:hypothetical protein OEZ86_003755 [Tetradesmus obliquus]
MGGGGIEKGSREWKRQQRRQTAARALDILSNIETSPLMPQQVAVLVSGSLLMCSWRFMSQRLQQFEQRGLSSLMEVWMVMAASFGMGQLARVVARSTGGELARNYSMAGQAASIAGSSSSSSSPYLPQKEGRESGSVAQPAAAEEDKDDVGVQKRIAQAEAAAKLAQYQRGLRQLLASIGSTGNIADDAQLLYNLADQLFGSPVNVCELVAQGGVPVILSAAKSALAALTGEDARVDVLPALMQLSWVLLQVAHGPPACCATLAEQPDVACTLLDIMGHEQQQQQQHASDQQQQQAGGKQRQQQQQLVPLKVLAQSAVSAILQPDSLHGLAYLLQHQPQLSDRLRGLVLGLLHYLLTFHAAELLQLLVEEHLVGSVATGAPPKLGRLLVCQLISVKGQEVLANIEANFELDVPLALAQVIPLPSVHLKLPPAPQQQQQQAGEIQPDGEAAADAPAAAQPQPTQQQQQQQVADDVYTDVLACRLLLQHSRLDELLTAFKDELCRGDAAAAAAGSSGAPLSPVCSAVLRLVQHLMSRDLELAAVRHELGDSIDESLSSSGSSSSSSVIDAALAMPDASGVYSSVMSGLVPEGDLPAGEAAGVSRSSSSSSLLVLPPLPEAARAPCSSCSGSSSSKHSGRVIFEFGPLQHSVSRCTYKAIKGSSKFIGSILRHEKPSASTPVRALTTPHFTPEANAWVLRCLERWLTHSTLEGFSAAQAAKLWVAADFLQVDGLQVACEDVVVAAAAQDASQREVALELCARHRASSARLQRLAVRVVLRSLLQVGAGPAAAACDSSCVARLAELMQRHGDVMSPGLLAEVRDRLVTLCMLNAGLDDDTPDDVVE